MMYGNLDMIIDDLKDGWASAEDYPYINSRALALLYTQYPDERDIMDANKIIQISNALYNNTELSILPLDDGVYDLLMVWLQRYKDDYQIGAAQTDIVIEMEPSFAPIDNTQLIKPLIKLEPKRGMTQDQMLFYNDIVKQRELNRDMFLKRPLYNATPLKKQNVKTTHKYPKLVGTLDKCKFVLNQQAIDKGVFDDANVQIFERDFIQKNILNGVIDPNQKFCMVLELKYDGISVEADVSDHVRLALSRGDTNNNIATDLTPVLGGYKFPKAIGKVDPNEYFGMKFEAMLSNLDLSRLGMDKEKVYKNPRNAMTGLVGSSDANRWRDYITLVPLATSLDIDRLTELELMNEYYDNGEILRYAVVSGDYKEILLFVKRFVDEAEYLRPVMPYIYDGVVCSFVEVGIINKLGRVNSVNKFQMAIKFNPQKKQTIFVGYTFSVAANGVITPIAHYRPVELFGCTHVKTTVHSYSRFMELGLKEGDIVSIELINDVIPYITRMDIKDNEFNTNPVIQFPTNCSECGASLEFSTTGKSALCPNHQCPGRSMGILVNMFSKINFKDFSEESLKAIGMIHNLTDLLNVDREDIRCLGEKEADNFMSRLEEFKTTPIYDFNVIGALGFSNVGRTKWKLILNKIPINIIVSGVELRTALLAVKGIGPNAADTIISELDIFQEDLLAIMKMPNVIWTYGVKLNKKIRFTGCRDKDLIETLSLQGYDITDGGVTKDTDILLVPEEGFVSTKTKNAGPECTVVDIETFKSNLNRYL